MKQVRNLLDELVKVACEKVGHDQDYRFNPWAKPVTKVTNQSNGYCFQGDFIKDGTVEVEVKPTVFLVCTSSGSRKYQTKYYNVVLMDAEGNLTATDIQTNDKTRGWALRIRSQVTELIQSLDDTPKSDRERFLSILKERFGILSEDEIITAALNLYEMHTRDR